MFCGGTEGHLVARPFNKFAHETCLNEHVTKQIKANVKSYLKAAGVRERYIDCSFDNFKATCETLKGAIKALSEIDQQFLGSVFLISKTSGTGKTHLAIAVLRKLILSGIRDSVFVSSPSLFLEIKNSFDSATAHESEIIEKYCSVPFLVVDDIGVERVSDWAKQIWYIIIDRRYSDMKPTIYTSNLSLGEIAEFYGDRIASRLSAGIVLTIDAKDYRLANRVK